mgnify:CR=1 FL=1
MTDQKNNIGCRNTGGRNTGDWNTGNHNTGGWNTGNHNTGDCNTGNHNTGDCNTGFFNTGDCNTGNHNTGDCNTGYRNTGSYNTGDHNTGDYNTGFFNAKTPLRINVFDEPVNYEVWRDCEKPKFIYFDLTLWIPKSEMTELEKDENPSYLNAEGYLKKLDYKEAFKASYAKAAPEDKKKIFNIPNFDADKFFEISGVDVRKGNELEHKKSALIAKANELLKQAEEL